MRVSTAFNTMLAIPGATVAGVSYPTGGDVITAFNGTKVTTSQQLRALIDAHKPGDTVKLTVLRGGKTRTVEVKLGVRSS